MSAIIDPHRRRWAATCGFTLVEVLVILAILTLMAGIVFPSVEKAMRRQSFVESARRVELGLRAARGAAVARGAPARFVVALDGRGFRFADHDDRLPEGVTITAPSHGITFFADGSTAGGEVEISSGVFRRHIAVSAALGTIEPRQ
ncbi:prepilin-type N-terminal cleavage/methylation domain-containing protein [Sphingomonas sp. KR3-1]|uniref:prepilin-type N-terminal cleavage/methylation domain-containing protein n=1 Tax=Sphingomonas sp. KR3-1 TaxID=3156611 RepID=UPI0032B34035